MEGPWDDAWDVLWEDMLPVGHPMECLGMFYGMNFKP